MSVNIQQADKTLKKVADTTVVNKSTVIGALEYTPVSTDQLNTAKTDLTNSIDEVSSNLSTTANNLQQQINALEGSAFDGDYNKLTNAPILNDADGTATFADETGNIIARIDNNGLETTNLNLHGDIELADEKLEIIDEIGNIVLRIDDNGVETKTTNELKEQVDNNKTAIDAKAPIDSPTFTGIPKAPTPEEGANAEQVATVGYVANAVAGLQEDIGDVFNFNDDGALTIADEQGNILAQFAVEEDVEGNVIETGLRVTDVATNSINSLNTEISNINTKINNRINAVNNATANNIVLFTDTHNIKDSGKKIVTTIDDDNIPTGEAVKNYVGTEISDYNTSIVVPTYATKTELANKATELSSATTAVATDLEEHITETDRRGKLHITAAERDAWDAAKDYNNLENKPIEQDGNDKEFVITYNDENHIIARIDDVGLRIKDVEVGLEGDSYSVINKFNNIHTQIEALKIFSKINAGETEVAADNNNDTLTLTPGTNVSITAEDNTITINANAISSINTDGNGNAITAASINEEDKTKLTFTKGKTFTTSNEFSTYQTNVTTALDAKANAADVYTKIEIDGKVEIIDGKIIDIQEDLEHLNFYEEEESLVITDGNNKIAQFNDKGLETTNIIINNSNYDNTDNGKDDGIAVQFNLIDKINEIETDINNLDTGKVDNNDLSNYYTKTVANGLLNEKAPLASPALTGTPTAPTAAAGTNTTQIATTAFVSGAISTTQENINTALNEKVAIDQGIDNTGKSLIVDNTGIVTPGYPTKLNTARKIKLNGDATGEASFDGSADIVITTAISALDDKVDNNEFDNHVTNYNTFKDDFDSKFNLNLSEGSLEIVDDPDETGSNTQNILARFDSEGLTTVGATFTNPVTVGEPEVDTNAATKKYVDDVSSIKMDKENPTGTGSFSLNRRANTTIGNNSVAIGIDTTASGNASYAEGYSVIADGHASHAEGYGSEAYGRGSHAEGANTIAKGNFSHTEGCRIDNVSGYITGVANTTTYTVTVNEGEDLDSLLAYVAIGRQIICNGNKASIVSYDTDNNTITLDKTLSENTNLENIEMTLIVSTIASNDGAHAEGCSTVANEEYSHAEGYLTTASGTTSHAEGRFTIASGGVSHAEGQSTTASGPSSHTEGVDTIASGYWSHAEGYHTVASRRGQHVQGEYNIIEDEGGLFKGEYAHIVGNGTADDARSNAHTLDWDGNAWFAGDVYVGGTGQDDETAEKLVKQSELENYLPLTGGTLTGDLNSSERILVSTVSSNKENRTVVTPYTIAVMSLGVEETSEIPTKGVAILDTGIMLTNGENNASIHVSDTGETMIDEDKIATKSDISALHIGGRNLIAGTDDTTVFSNAAASAEQSIDVWTGVTIAPPTRTEYVVSFDAKADEAMDINCYFHSPNTTLTSESSTGDKRTDVVDGTSKVSVTTEWQRYWVKWTQTSTDTIKQIIVGRNSSTSTLYIRAVKLEEGNMPSAWSSAPEDNSTPNVFIQTDTPSNPKEGDLWIDTDDEGGEVLAAVATSGNYNDLINKPTIITMEQVRAEIETAIAAIAIYDGSVS